LAAGKKHCIAFASLLRHNQEKGVGTVSKTATINMRIEPTIKAQAEHVFPVSASL